MEDRIPQINIMDTHLELNSHLGRKDCRHIKMLCDDSSVMISQEIGPHAWPYPSVFWEHEYIHPRNWTATMKRCVRRFYEDIRSKVDYRCKNALNSESKLIELGVL